MYPWSNKLLVNFTRLTNIYIYLYIYILYICIYYIYDMPPNIYHSTSIIQSSLICITPNITSTQYMLLLRTENMGRVCEVSLAARFRLDGPEIEYRWGWHFPQPSKPALGPTQLSIQWTPAHSRDKISGPRVDHPTHLEPRWKKEYSYTCKP